MPNFSMPHIVAASVSAEKFENFFTFLFDMGIVSMVLVVGAAFYYAVRYHRKGKEIGQTPRLEHNFTLEFTSIFVTSIVVGIVFFWGYLDYRNNISPKMDELEINVIGQQWSWQIQYANGKTLINEVYLPKGRNVKFILTSKDVIHSFYVPAFRLKKDVSPGLYTDIRVTPTVAGTYDLFCTEYCGTSHSAMLGKVHVLEPEDYKKWESGLYKAADAVTGMGSSVAHAASGGAVSMAAKGAELYKTKTCFTCHSVDGSKIVGPSFKGIFGKTEEMQDGQKVVVDENYIRESVYDPQKKIVKGFPPAMPTFRGMVSDEELNYLIAYIKSLK